MHVFNEKASVLWSRNDSIILIKAFLFYINPKLEAMKTKHVCLCFIAKLCFSVSRMFSVMLNHS